MQRATTQWRNEINSCQLENNIYCYRTSERTHSRSQNSIEDRVLSEIRNTYVRKNSYKTREKVSQRGLAWRIHREGSFVSVRGDIFSKY